MYESFYGLKEKPFSLTPDPEFLFMNQQHRGAFDQILYGIQRREGFTVIVGDVGTGKTTLCWSLLGKLDTKSLRTAIILNPLLSEEEILKAILQDLGVQPSVTRQGKHASEENQDSQAGNKDRAFESDWMKGLSKKDLIDELNAYLSGMIEKDVFTVILIDESQDLSVGALEQIRLLSNLETSKKKLLQIIFVGQVEFEKKLRLPELRQLNQRISNRYRIKPLTKEDTIRYVHHRLSVAGCTKSLNFTRAALSTLYRNTKGYPRLINLVCDRSLVSGYMDRSYTITKEMVKNAVRSLAGNDKPAERGFGASLLRPIPLAGAVLAALVGVSFWLASSGMPPLEWPTFDSASAKSESQPIARLRTESLPTQSTRVAAPVDATEIVTSSSTSTVHSSAASAPSTTISISHAPDLPEVGRSNTVAAEKVESVEIEVSTDRGEDRGNSRGTETAPQEGIRIHSVAGEGYIIQLHSLRTKSRAKAALVKLESQGHPAYMRFYRDGGGNWFVIYVGPFANLDLAKEKAILLEGQDNADPIIRGLSG